MRFTYYKIMHITFKQYLNEFTSIGDDNVIGGLLFQARQNLNSLKKQQPKQRSCIDCILLGLDKIEQDPMLSYIDGYSTVNYLQQLINPRITPPELNALADVLGSGAYESGD